MRYFSVCSGIEAASVAWEPLGWEAQGFSEIDPFSSAVLKHRYPSIRNYGDLNDFAQWGEFGSTVDLIVGGTPCQAFSIAGFRKGIVDPRGNLSLVFLSMVAKVRPTWIVWENVPGVLSSNEGRDYASFIGGLSELGYGFAWRVLDAQYFGVPQRRRRVFLVANSTSASRAASVLFEPEGLQRYFAKKRKALKKVTTNFREGFARMRGFGDYAVDTISGPLKARDHKDATDLIIREEPNFMPYVKARKAQSVLDYETWIPSDISPTLNCFENAGDVRATVAIVNDKPTMTVRRLTPVECERLQGFPDDWTNVNYNGHPSSDAARFKVLGNSMAVPVMRWIGNRINFIEEVCNP